MNPQDPIVDELMRSALARERREQWREASTDYLRVIRQAPRWALGYLCLGCALGKAGDHEAAAQVLSLGLDVEHVDAGGDAINAPTNSQRLRSLQIPPAPQCAMTQQAEKLQHL